jgi:hypothetical protein
MRPRFGFSISPGPASAVAEEAARAQALGYDRIGIWDSPVLFRGEGAREAGRSLADIEVWFTCFWFVDEEPGAAARRGAWACTSFASHFAKAGVEGKWVPEELAAGVLELGRAYDFDVHGSVPEAKQGEYVELAERLGVLQYLRERPVV